MRRASWEYGRCHPYSQVSGKLPTVPETDTPKLATHWQLHYPQVIHSFLHHWGRAVGCASLGDPALPAGSPKVWHLAGAADQQVELVESFV